MADLTSGKVNPLSDAGQCDRPVKLSDFTDLADYSCLNGWTMGNVAVANCSFLNMCLRSVVCY
jgi:hypothetical protein